VTGTEYAPDFFAEAGWDHRRSEMFIDPPALPRAGAPDSPGAAALPRISRVDTNVWHWAMVKALGGPDLRSRLVDLHLHGGYFRSVGEAPFKRVLGFEAALPFLYADFGPRERLALGRRRRLDGAEGPVLDRSGLPGLLDRERVPRLPLPVLLERAGVELRHLVGAARAGRRRLVHQGRGPAGPLRPCLDPLDRVPSLLRPPARRRALPP